MSSWPTPATVHDPPMTAQELIARDELLLRRASLQVRIGRVTDTALVIGVAQDDQSSSIRRAREAGVKVARRSSGGTGVLLTAGDLAWAVVAPRRSLPTRWGIQRAYSVWGAGVTRALQRQGISSAWVSAPGISREFCELSDRGHVLAVAGRVLGGAAQHLTRDALLHHGVVRAEPLPDVAAHLFGLGPAVIGGHLTSLEELGLTVQQRRSLESGILADVAAVVAEAFSPHPGGGSA